MLIVRKAGVDWEDRVSGPPEGQAVLRFFCLSLDLVNQAFYEPEALNLM